MDVIVHNSLLEGLRSQRIPIFPYQNFYTNIVFKIEFCDFSRFYFMISLVLHSLLFIPVSYVRDFEQHILSKFAVPGKALSTVMVGYNLMAHDALIGET